MAETVERRFPVAKMAGLLGCALLLLACACGGGGDSSTTTSAAQNPIPSITSLQPGSAAAGADAFTVTISGQNFVSSATVQVNSTTVGATFVSSTQLNAQVPATQLAAPGSLPIAVTNPGPGGGTATSTLTVTAPPTPTVSTVTPAPVVPGSVPTLTVSGQNFVRSSVVQWNAGARATSYVDNHTLSAVLQAGDAVAGLSTVAVVTPAPGGGTSSPYTVKVEYPLPVIASLNPAVLLLGSPDTVISILGRDFYPGALVQLNGISRQTTFVSNTELRATIVAADLVAPPSNKVLTVLNPSPTAGYSNGVVMAVQYPVPVIQSVSPSTAIAASELPIVITGQNFFPGSTLSIFVNGTQVPCDLCGCTAQSPSEFALQWISSTELRTTLDPLLLSHLPSTTVKVVNPVPGGGTSNPVEIALDAGNSPSNLTGISYTGNGDCFPVTVFDASSDLRYVAFEGYASGFSTYVSMQLTDVCWGAPPGCASGTALASGGGGKGIGCGRYPVSATGRYVAFDSCYDTPPTTQLILHYSDTCVGAPPVPTCVPASSVLSPPASIEASAMEMDASGRFVHFRDAILSQSWVADACASASGCTPSFQVLAVDPIGAERNAVGTLAANGRYFVFADLSATDPTITELYFRDTCLGVTGCTPSTVVLASRPVDAVPWKLALNASGSYVLGLPLGVANTCAGVAPPCTPTFTSLSIPGLDVSATDRWMFGGDRYLAFTSSQASLVPNDTNNRTDTFLYDTCLGAAPGCMPSVRRVSVNSSGVQADRNTFPVKLNPDASELLMSTRGQSYCDGATNLPAKLLMVAPIGP